MLVSGSHRDRPTGLLPGALNGVGKYKVV